MKPEKYIVCFQGSLNSVGVPHVRQSQPNIYRSRCHMRVQSLCMALLMPGHDSKDRFACLCVIRIIVVIMIDTLMCMSILLVFVVLMLLAVFYC